MSLRTYFEELEFDLPTALIHALVALLDEMPSATLTEKHVSTVENEQGIYQLFLDDALVYIGKTDADAGLQTRLRRHSKKILGRVGLNSNRVTFKAVRIYVFTAMDLEELLISHFGLTSTNSWNNSGFGANDPGRERDTTKLKEHHFDKKFPIQLQLPVDVGANGKAQSVNDVLVKLKKAVPYLIRAQTAGGGSKRPHDDLVKTRITIPTKKGLTAERVLRLIKTALGAEWQVTALPGYIVIYKEERPYSEGEILLAI